MNMCTVMRVPHIQIIRVETVAKKIKLLDLIFDSIQDSQ